MFPYPCFIFSKRTTKHNIIVYDLKTVSLNTQYVNLLNHSCSSFTYRHFKTDLKIIDFYVFGKKCKHGYITQLRSFRFFFRITIKSKFVNSRQTAISIRSVSFRRVYIKWWLRWFSIQTRYPIDGRNSITNSIVLFCKANIGREHLF